MNGTAAPRQCRWPEKVEYSSEALAKNAAMLHTLASKDGKCSAVAAYPCPAGHFHVGHTSKRAADRCKTELQTSRPRDTWKAERKGLVESGEAESMRQMLEERDRDKTKILTERKKRGKTRTSGQRARRKAEA
jgi:hypothetical protein